MITDAERLKFYEAGSDPRPRAPGVAPSAENLWHELLNAPPDKRIAHLRHLLGSADVARACFVEDHRGQAEMLGDQIARLRDTLRRAGVRE